MTRGPALDHIRERIHRLGPIGFAEFMELALYGPGGFYETGGGPGRARDFVTSPEIGPLFGTVMARALDSWWSDLGEPDPFVVVDAGAARGALARSIAAAAPDCSAALHYLLVERSAALRESHAAAVPLEPPSWALAGRAPGQGPTFASLGEMPAERFTGVVIANELLDNLPVALLERSDQGWGEVRVGEDSGALHEIAVEAPGEVAGEAGRLAPDAGPGSRIPLQRDATEWLRHVRTLVDRGRVVVVDYASPTADLAARTWTSWLRAYRSQTRSADVLAAPGAQDITCEVAVDQLSSVHAPDLDRSQAEFLEAHGIGELVATARAGWHARAHLGDLDAVKARSRVDEAAALLDEAGLGGFRVLEWQV